MRVYGGGNGFETGKIQTRPPVLYCPFHSPLLPFKRWEAKRCQLRQMRMIHTTYCTLYEYQERQSGKKKLIEYFLKLLAILYAGCVCIQCSRRERMSKANDGTFPAEEESHVNDLTSSTSSPKQVSFDSVTIREFNIQLGDHPDVSDEGPPLALDYDELLHTYHLTVDKHQSLYSPNPRTKAQLRIPGYIREEKLNQDYSKKQIYRQIQQSIRVKNERFTSQSNGHTEALEQAWQSVWKKIRKVTTGENRRVVPAKEWLRQNYRAGEVTQAAETPKIYRRRASDPVTVKKNTQINAQRSRSMTNETEILLHDESL